MNLNRAAARYIDCTLSILCAARNPSSYSSAPRLLPLPIIAPDQCAESSISRDPTRRLWPSIINRRPQNLENLSSISYRSLPAASRIFVGDHGRTSADFIPLTFQFRWIAARALLFHGHRRDLSVPFIGPIRFDSLLDSAIDSQSTRW